MSEMTTTPPELLNILILLTHTEPRRYPFEVRGREHLIQEQTRKSAGIQAHLAEMAQGMNTATRAKQTIDALYCLFLESPCMPVQETAQLIYALMQQKEAE